MNPKYSQTDSKLQYGIPGLFELQESFEFAESTGTMSSYVQFENFKSYLNKNITSRSESQLDPALYYYYNLPQAFGLSENLQEQLLWWPYIYMNIDAQARALINSIENKTVVHEANTILDLLKEQLLRYSPADLPAITAFQLDNGSLGLEWVIGHFRLGFNFENNPEESGYFLISDRTAGEIRNYGNFNGLNKRTLIKSLLVQILEN